MFSGYRAMSSLVLDTDSYASPSRSTAVNSSAYHIFGWGRVVSSRKFCQGSTRGIPGRLDVPCIWTS